MFEDGVRHDDVGENVAIFNQVDLVQCKMVINDEYFIDGFDLGLHVSTHLIINVNRGGCRLATCGRAEFELEATVRVGFAEGAALEPTRHVLSLVLLVEHLDNFPARQLPKSHLVLLPSTYYHTLL